MKKILFVVIITAFAAVFIYTGLSKHPKKIEPAIAPNSPVENLQVEEKIYSKGVNIMVYTSASPQLLGEADEIKSGTKLKILDKENSFYHVQYMIQGEVKEGFIPIWYLDNDKAEVKNCDSDYQALREADKGLLYPGGPEIVDLEKAKLLKPFMESGEWVNVNIIVYDVPNVLTAWIKKDSLVSPDKMQPKEGFIPSEAELYFVGEFKDIQSAQPQKEDYPKSIYIIKREGGYANVSAAGGWNAWVEEKWIRYSDKNLK